MRTSLPVVAFCGLWRTARRRLQAAACRSDERNAVNGVLVDAVSVDSAWWCPY